MIPAHQLRKLEHPHDTAIIVQLLAFLIHKDTISIPGEGCIYNKQGFHILRYIEGNCESLQNRTMPEH